MPDGVRDALCAVRLRRGDPGRCRTTALHRVPGAPLRGDRRGRRASGGAHRTPGARSGEARGARAALRHLAVGAGDLRARPGAAGARPARRHPRSPARASRRAPAVIDGASLGFPGPLAELAPGDYFAQAVINVYEEARRADGHRIWVHLNDGSQEPFQVAAGNLYSDVQPLHVGAGAALRIAVTHVVPAPERPVDTHWVKHVQIKSGKLTAFWGRPVYVNATVLLPKGYAEHPASRYPSVYTLGHNVPFSFSTDSARARGLGALNPVTGLETGFDFYRAWSAEGFPRVIAISFEQQTPYFPDSYSVNSANNGPYGDAIVEEVIPWLEEHFRII